MGYVVSRNTYKLKSFYTWVIFIPMIFNGGMLAGYVVNTNILHLRNSIWALILPLAVSPFNIVICKTFFKTTIPDSIVESAKIDGAGHTKIFFQITFPLGKPILVTMGLFSALAYWNDWTNGLYYLSGNQGQKLYSIQNLLNQMITDIQYLASGKVAGNIGAEVAKLPTTSIRMAIAFIAMLPLFIIYPFLQKYFAEGITLGAVKG